MLWRSSAMVGDDGERPAEVSSFSAVYRLAIELISD
jgi:hypothetical protein